MSVTIQPGIGISKGISFIVFDDGTRLRSDEWRTYASKSGHTVYRALIDTEYPFVLEFTKSDGKTYAYKTKLLAQVNEYLSDPVKWEATEQDRIARAAASGSVFHSIVKSVSKAVSQVGDVTAGVVDFGIQLDEALIHPLTVNSSGLQLSSDAIQVVPDKLKPTAQLITAVGGYVTIGGAAATAVGGVGSLGEIAKDAGSALATAKGAYQAYETIEGILQPVETLPPPRAPIARGTTSYTGPLVAAGLVAVALVLLIARK